MAGSSLPIGATAKPGYNLDVIAKAVQNEIDRLAAEGPTDAELARARNTHLADFYKGLTRDRVKLANVDDIVASPTSEQRWKAVGI